MKSLVRTLVLATTLMQAAAPLGAGLLPNASPSAAADAVLSATSLLLAPSVVYVAPVADISPGIIVPGAMGR